MRLDTTNLKEIIEGKKCYVIPSFQRPYRWDKEKRSELWYDILSQYEKQIETPSGHGRSRQKAPTHYMGTMVFAGPSNLKGISSMDVIDGQQRLTTLLTVLAAIRDSRIKYTPSQSLDRADGEKNSKKKSGKKSKKKSDGTSREEFEEFNKDYFVNPKAKPEHRYRLRLQEQDRAALESVILKQKPKANNDFEKNLVYDSYRHFYRLINSSKDAVESDDKTRQFSSLFPLDLESLEQVVLTSLIFIQIETADADDVNAIFESLNAKGQELEQIDLIKNYYYMLLGTDSAEEDMIKYWGGVTKFLPRDELQQRFIWTYYVSRGNYGMQKKVYSLVRAELLNVGARTDPAQMHKHLQGLAEWAPVFAELSKIEDSGVVDGHSFFTPAEAIAISRVYQAGGSTCAAFFLWLARLKKENLVDEGGVVDCAAYLESYIVRRFLCALPPNNLNLSNGKLLTQLARIDKKADPVSALKDGLIQADLEWPTDERLLDSMISAAFYRNGDGTQRFFVLGEIDRALDPRTRKNYSESDNSIEHIIPQSAASDESWRAYFSSMPSLDSFVENYVHTLGNLTLVRNDENSRLGSALLDAKALIYAESEYKITRETNLWLKSKLINGAVFDMEILKERAKWLHVIVCKRWPR